MHDVLVIGLLFERRSHIVLALAPHDPLAPICGATGSECHIGENQEPGHSLKVFDFGITDFGFEHMQLQNTKLVMFLCFRCGIGGLVKSSLLIDLFPGICKSFLQFEVRDH